jgi:hypothetical protein
MLPGGIHIVALKEAKVGLQTIHISQKDHHGYNGGETVSDPT